jgi:hypothetical protein
MNGCSSTDFTSWMRAANVPTRWGRHIAQSKQAAAEGEEAAEKLPLHSFMPAALYALARQTWITALQQL